MYANDVAFIFVTNLLIILFCELLDPWAGWESAARELADTRFGRWVISVGRDKDGGCEGN